MRTCGIYTITCLANNKVYVGNSVCVEDRLGNHKWNLKNNTHINEYLQRAWNLYNENNFLFELLEECEERFLYSEENYWVNLLDTLNIERGYNLRPTNPEKVGKCSDKTKLKISIANKGRIPPSKGKKLSSEVKEKIRISNIGLKRSDYTKERVKEGRKNQDMSHLWKEISQYDMNGNYIQDFPSFRHAKEFLGHKNDANLVACCKGKRPQVGGFKWKYKQ